MLKLCVAGAAGRMGNAVIHEAVAKGHQITTGSYDQGDPVPPARGRVASRDPADRDVRDAAGGLGFRALPVASGLSLICRYKVGP